jgi:3D-(3,5/4)-trihydroxycyclohexane-1,2-dione acylhydrolase (decyclizing)
MNDYVRDIGGTITESNGVGIIREVADEDAIVVAAAGSLPADLERLWVTDAKDSYNMEYGASCMGYEIAGALGSKLACPDKEVYSLVGDGSFMMLNSELPTIMQEGVKVTVVFDNAAFGCINNLQMGNGVGSLRPRCVTEPRAASWTEPYCYTDFAKVGEGYGLKASPPRLRKSCAKRSDRRRRRRRSACIIDAKVLPKTMAEGYNSWWHIGVASTAKRIRLCLRRERELMIISRRQEFINQTGDGNRYRECAEGTGNGEINDCRINKGKTA